VRQKLTVDAQFADSARDQEAVLGAEIEDNDGLAHLAAVGSTAGGCRGGPGVFAGVSSPFARLTMPFDRLRMS
jgi:hypothetical protein